MDEIGAMTQKNRYTLTYLTAHAPLIKFELCAPKHATLTRKCAQGEGKTL